MLGTQITAVRRFEVQRMGKESTRGGRFGVSIRISRETYMAETTVVCRHSPLLGDLVRDLLPVGGLRS